MLPFTKEKEAINTPDITVLQIAVEEGKLNINGETASQSPAMILKYLAERFTSHKR